MSDCGTCNEYTRQYNVAVANGLVNRARSVNRMLDAHERSSHPRKTATTMPGHSLPTTNLGRDLIDAWMLHDIGWHGNFFLKREADGSLTRLDPTKVTVALNPGLGYQGGSYAMVQEPQPKTCPGCKHVLPDPHKEVTEGTAWCIQDMDAVRAVGEDPRSVGPCY